MPPSGFLLASFAAGGDVKPLRGNRTRPSGVPDRIDVFADLSTALIADACLRCRAPLRTAPAGIAPLARASRAAGRVLPARHCGSVDVFLEALDDATPGDVLVVDNGGRADEACIGDLTVLEAAAAGVVGVVVWGLHRDTSELLALGLPVFSYGATPAGPVRVDPREHGALRTARFGAHVVGRDDLVFADDDGVLFVAARDVERVLEAATAIRAVERRQAERMRAGEPLRVQTDFAAYLARRAGDPSYTFRAHLRGTGGAVEE